MRALGLVLYLWIPVFSVQSAEVETLSFYLKGYSFQAKVSDDNVSIDWQKSGFKRNFSGKLSPCNKKQLKREVASLRNKFFSPRGRHSLGTKVQVSWNQEKTTRNFYPRELDKLDKRFSFLYSISQYGEGKCKK